MRRIERSARTASSSLFRRLMIGFALTTAALWLLTAAFTIGWAFRLGDAQIAKGLRTYAHQILAAAAIFADDPQRLARALGEVQAIEREAADPDGMMLIQAWKAGQHIGPTLVLPKSVPESAPSIQTYEHEGRVYLAYTASDVDAAITVRASVYKRGVASLMWPSAGFVFAPLLTSLPLLLIPAWLTIRRGLVPLRTLVDAIHERVRALKLEPIAMSAYRELSPLVAAVNELMSRLRGQLDRERAFVAEVAHEIKTPLAIVRANLDAVRAPVSAERRDAALSDLETGIDRADRLIRRLLQLARMEHDAREHSWRRFDLSEFVRLRVAAMVPVADQRRIALAMQADDRLQCRSDPDAIGAIIDNLLDNAIKFSPAGSTVRISLEPIGAGVELSVSDNGPGIAPHLLDAAFERFSRIGPRDQPGIGLGLAIVKRAVQRIGGKMTVGPVRKAWERSADNSPEGPGEGMQACVWIPFDSDPRSPSESPLADRRES